jgi:hypothetical protein
MSSLPAGSRTETLASATGSENDKKFVFHVVLAVVGADNLGLVDRTNEDCSRPVALREAQADRRPVGYWTKRDRSTVYSFSESEPLALSRSSFSISSAALKPTTWRNSSRACWARAWFRSAMPRPCVSR